VWLRGRGCRAFGHIKIPFPFAARKRQEIICVSGYLILSDTKKARLITQTGFLSCAVYYSEGSRPAATKRL